MCTVENDSDSDEDFDQYSYVYEIDENAEGQIISSPSNVQVPTPLVNIQHIIPTPNRHSFGVITFIFICLLISSAFFLSIYLYIKLTLQKVILQPSTANLISFNANHSHVPLNVTFSYKFYNPNYEYNLDVHDGTVVLYSRHILHKPLVISFSDLSLQPRQQKIVDFNFFAKDPDFRLDSYTEYFLRNNRYYFELTVKVRMRIYILYFPLSFYRSKVHTCQFMVKGQPPTGSVPVSKITCQ